MKGNLTFPAVNRLRKTRDYQCVRQQGRRFHSAHFIIIVYENGLGRSRLGLTVSRKVGNAVCRNRLKRWLREFYRHQHKPLGQSLDISIVAKRQAGHINHPQLTQELQNLFARLETGRNV